MADIFIFHKVYIHTIRLTDAPQVRLTQKKVEPFISLESCKAFCNKVGFSYVIKDWHTDKNVYVSDQPNDAQIHLLYEKTAQPTQSITQDQSVEHWHTNELGNQLK
jgi:hypothetical protein